MKQISIYKEEIFRRSKVKLQQRQKRRRKTMEQYRRCRPMPPHANYAIYRYKSTTRYKNRKQIKSRRRCTHTSICVCRDTNKKGGKAGLRNPLSCGRGFRGLAGKAVGGHHPAQSCLPGSGKGKKANRRVIPAAEVTSFFARSTERSSGTATPVCTAPRSPRRRSR